MRRPGERLVLSGRTAGGWESGVGAGADAFKRPCFASNTPEPYIRRVDCTSLGGPGCSCSSASSVVPRWPTCGCAAVSAASAGAGQLSGEIIALPAPSPLNRHSSCLCMCVSLRAWLGQQSQAANEQMKHRLNENRKATLSIKKKKKDGQSVLPNGALIQCAQKRFISLRTFFH